MINDRHEIGLAHQGLPEDKRMVNDQRETSGNAKPARGDEKPIETLGGTIRRTDLTGWDDLANDAELALNETKERAKKLKIALGIFRDNARRGEPYPNASTHN